jgi:hypothetical protein
MTVAVLLRLISGAQANGRVVGHAEIVDTGETEAFRNEKEMLAILERVSGTPTNETAQPGTHADDC